MERDTHFILGVYDDDFDLRSTDDKHIMAIDIANNSSLDLDKITEILNESGATEVNKKSFE